MSEKWNLTEDNAALVYGKWVLETNPVCPLDGVRVSCRSEGIADQTKASWSLLKVQPVPKHSLTAEEAYIRGDDLIVSFDQTEQDPFAFQLNFRWLGETDGAIGIELWLSVQTDDLDSEPVLQIASAAPEGQYWHVLNHGEVVQDTQIPNASSTPAALSSPGDELSGVWLVEQGDQRHAERMSSPAEAEQRIELFGHFMEKGVIRRARMRFYLKRGDISDAEIKAFYEDFANSPLPLTA